MEEKEFQNLTDEMKTLLIAKMIMIQLIENFSYRNVLDAIYNCNKKEREKNELDKVITVLKQKTNLHDLTNIIFELKYLCDTSNENIEIKGN